MACFVVSFYVLRTSKWFRVTFGGGTKREGLSMRMNSMCAITYQNEPIQLISHIPSSNHTKEIPLAANSYGVNGKAFSAT